MIRTKTAAYFCCLKQQGFVLPTCLKLYLMRISAALRFGFNMYVANVDPAIALAKAIKYKNITLQLEAEKMLTPEPGLDVIEIRKRAFTVLLCLRSNPVTKMIAVQYFRSYVFFRYMFDLRNINIVVNNDTLFYAVKYENLDLIKILLSYFDPSIRFTLVKYAGFFGSSKVEQCFIDENVNYIRHMLPMVVIHNHLHILSRWIREGKIDIGRVVTNVCYNGNLAAFNMVKHIYDFPSESDHFTELCYGHNPSVAFFKQLLKKGNIDNAVSAAAYGGLINILKYSHLCGASLENIAVELCNSGNIHLLDDFGYDNINWHVVFSTIITNTLPTEPFYTENVLNQLREKNIIDVDKIYTLAMNAINK